MPRYIPINGLKLSYVEHNENSDKIIFFIHGNSGSFNTWHSQLSSAAFQNYRLIAIDLPGHGSSESSSNPDVDYSPIRIGKMIAEVVNILAANESYILVGFSFGTNVIGEMLLNNVEPVGIILVSSCVLSSVNDLQKIFLPNPNSANFFKDSISSEDLEKLALDCFYVKDDVALERFKSDFKNTKAPFRSTLMKKASEGAVSDEIKLLRQAGVASLTVFGKEDRIVNVDYLDGISIRTWRDTIYKLPAAGHFVQNDQAEAFNQLASNYINNLFTSTHA